MLLTLLRSFPQETETIGDLFVNNRWFCITLEDRIREVKVYGETAIPYGSYKGRLSWSPKFQRILPEILNVPNFTGIRIHPGNTHRDTSGCILVGEGFLDASHTALTKSRVTFDKLFALLEPEFTLRIISP